MRVGMDRPSSVDCYTNREASFERAEPNNRREQALA
jgi:hypothetical protein